MAEQTHRVVLHFDDGLDLKLICPETGCVPATLCASCGRDTEGDQDSKPCYDCPPPGGTECWVKSWFDNCTYDEILVGELTVEIDAEFHGDHMTATITDVVADASPRTDQTNGDTNG